MHENRKRVEKWLTSDSFGDMADFVNVSSAYLSMYDDFGQIPKDLLSRMEANIERNALYIEPHQAIQLAQIFSMCGSSHTMEIFDRIIGASIDDIPIQEVF